jgi:phage antirepressor YoqD-like protein
MVYHRLHERPVQKKKPESDDTQAGQHEVKNAKQLQMSGVDFTLIAKKGRERAHVFFK